MHTLIPALVLLLVSVAPPVSAESAGVKDPRNWPTVTRLVQDRFESGGKMETLRVYAKPTDYFNCGYRGSRASYRSFTLLGGPLETLTGYLPSKMGRVLEGLLAKDPWMPLTVEVAFETDKLSDLCPDQVKIIKWSIGWQYPSGSITPGKPDTTLHPTKGDLAFFDQKDLWTLLKGKELLRPSRNGPSELMVGEELSLTAGVRLSSAYHCAFKGAIKTHYALRLHDARGGFVLAYVARTPESRTFVDYVALHRDVLVRVKAKLVKQAQSHYCGYQLEVREWDFPKVPRTKPKRRR
jgi:hypothetical protein